VAQHFPGPPGVEPHGLREGEGFRGDGDVYSAEQLVDQFHLLAGAGLGADDRRGARHRVQQRLDARERAGAAGDHHQQVAVRGSGHASRDGRIDHLDTQRSQPFGPLLHRSRTNGGHH